MREKLLLVYRSPLVRKAFYGLLLAIAAALGFGQLGCHALTPAQEARVARFECQVRAVEPIVGDVLDAEALVRDVYAGRADLGRALNELRAKPAEVQALLDSLNACEDAPAALPAGEAS